VLTSYFARQVTIFFMEALRKIGRMGEADLEGHFRNIVFFSLINENAFCIRRSLIKELGDFSGNHGYFSIKLRAADTCVPA
jgi:hypothetical protein